MENGGPLSDGANPPLIVTASDKHTRGLPWPGLGTNAVARLILITVLSFNYPPLTDAEAGVERLQNLPKVTMPVSTGAEM